MLGQLFETTGPREGQDLLDHYIAVIEGKTGSLIAAAGEYGSLLRALPKTSSPWSRRTASWSAWHSSWLTT